MPAFFLTMMACLVITLGGREQVRTARLAAGLGKSAILLVIVWVCAIATSAIAAWVATLMAPLMPGQAKQMFVAIALLLSAAELAFLRAGPAPKEPTRSAGAIGIVMFAAQLTDAARFLVMALTLQTGEPVLAAAGGAFGSGLALTLALLAASEWGARVPQRLLSYLAAGVLASIAIVMGLSARGII